jgi:hypothetical protein
LDSESSDEPNGMETEPNTLSPTPAEPLVFLMMYRSCTAFTNTVVFGDAPWSDVHTTWKEITWCLSSSTWKFFCPSTVSGWAFPMV